MRYRENDTGQYVSQWVAGVLLITIPLVVAAWIGGGWFAALVTVGILIGGTMMVAGIVTLIHADH